MLLRRTSAWRHLRQLLEYFARLFGESNHWRDENPKHFKNNVSCGISKIHNLLTASTNIFAGSDVCGSFLQRVGNSFFVPSPFFADRKITQREPLTLL